MFVDEEVRFLASSGSRLGPREHAGSNPGFDSGSGSSSAESVLEEDASGGCGWVLHATSVRLVRRGKLSAKWVFRTGPGVLRRVSDGAEWPSNAMTWRLDFQH